jgi:hypothetical protein
MMFKFEYNDYESGIRTTMELTEDTLTHYTVAERFTEFLRSCGYVFDDLASYRLVDDEGNVLPSFEEKYRKIMKAAEDRYDEELGSTFPVI